MKQPVEHDGPHNLPHEQQERCAAEGRRIDGGEPCTVGAIRDRRPNGWVLYPHGVAGMGVLLADDRARTLRGHIGSRTEPRVSKPEGGPS